MEDKEYLKKSSGTWISGLSHDKNTKPKKNVKSGLVGLVRKLPSQKTKPQEKPLLDYLFTLNGLVA